MTKEIKCDHPGCNGNHIPNKKTRKSLRDSEKAKNRKSYDTIEQLFEELGI